MKYYVIVNDLIGGVDVVGSDKDLSAYTAANLPRGIGTEMAWGLVEERGEWIAYCLNEMEDQR